MIGEMGVDSFLQHTTDLGVHVLLPNFEEGQMLTGHDQPEAIAARLAELYGGALIV